MKKLTYISIIPFLVCCFNSYSQKKMEIGIGTYDLQSFRFVLKKNTKPNKYLQYRFGDFGIDTQRDSVSKSGRFAGSFGLIFEKRKEIGEKMRFIHGFAPSLYLSYLNQKIFAQTEYTEDIKTSNIYLRPKIGYLLGVQYHFSEKFYAALQTLPGITFNLNFTEDGFKKRLDLEGHFKPRGEFQLVYKF